MTFNMTEELLERLTIAQLDYVHNITKPDLTANITDSYYDRLEGALDLANNLLTMHYEGDLNEFATMFDPDEIHFVAGNPGACPEIQELLK